MDHSLGPAFERAVEKFTILVARYHDHSCLFSLRDELFKSPQLIVQDVRVHQQHIGVRADGLGETLRVLAFSNNLDIALICDRAAQSEKGKWLIVRNHKIDITHNIHSNPARSLRSRRDIC